jgi:hypothetical protein
MSKNKEIGCYLLHNPNTDEFYVGSGIMDDRRVNHIKLLKKNSHYNSKLQEAYNKDPNFEFICSETETREEAFLLEQSIIDDFSDSSLLLNISKSSIGNGKQSEETKEKLRQISIKQFASQEVRELCSQRSKKLCQDPEHIEKISKAAKEGWASLTAKEKQAFSEKTTKALLRDYASGARPSLAGQTRSQEFCEQDSVKITEKWKDPIYRETQRLARIGKMVGHNKIPTIVDGVSYESASAAAKAHNLSDPGALHRFRSEKYPNWQILS